MPQPVIDAPAVQPPPPPPPPQIPDIPPPPPLPSVSVTLPGGEVFPLTGLPQNAEQLQGLRERREILRDQLERATNRRNILINELNGDGEREPAPEARAGIQQRLNLIDERILQIERDQALTERLLSSADPEVLAAASSRQRDLNNMVSEDEAAGVAFTTFGAGVLIAMAVGRFRRRRSKAQPAAAGATMSLADDPRIEQLTQTVEAIAEEVERIGEGQRFVTQLLANRPEAAVLRGEPQGR